MTSTILVINGPNLNRLGKRRPEYGTTTLQDVIDGLEGVASQLGVKILHKQSNTEGELLTGCTNTWTPTASSSTPPD